MARCAGIVGYLAIKRNAAEGPVNCALPERLAFSLSLSRALPR